MELEYLLINSDEDDKGTNWGYLNLNNASIEVETKTAIKQGLVVVVTPLDIMSIAL